MDVTGRDKGSGKYDLNAAVLCSSCAVGVLLQNLVRFFCARVEVGGLRGICSTKGRNSNIRFVPLREGTHVNECEP